MNRYIDADAALKRFEGMHGNESELLNCYNADWVVSFIETQPTADVQEVKHGKWDVKDLTPYCSICHKPSEYECDGVHSQPLFCPNCGAKMDGGESE